MMGISPSTLWMLSASLLIIGLVLLGAGFAWYSPSARSRRHQRKRAQAKRVIERIHSFAEPGQRLAYLRKIDPFAFEELLLDAFERQGYAVKRSESYSGDGGIDGTVTKEGQRFLIQAKRYSGHIQLAHLKDFQRVLHTHQCKGIFIHTGRTGKQSREFVQACDQMQILSGGKLLAFLQVSQTSSAAEPVVVRQRIEPSLSSQKA